jgi:hypothetical protein
VQRVRPSVLVEEVIMAMVSCYGSVLTVKSSDGGPVLRKVAMQIQWR